MRIMTINICRDCLMDVMWFSCRFSGGFPWFSRGFPWAKGSVHDRCLLLSPDSHPFSHHLSSVSCTYTASSPSALTHHAYACQSAMLSHSYLTHHLYDHMALYMHTSLMHTLASPQLHTLLCVLRSHSKIHAWPLTHANSSQDSHQFISGPVTHIATHNTSSLNLWLMPNSSYTLICTHLFQILLCMILNSCWLTSRFIPIYLSSHIYHFTTHIDSSLNLSRSISILRMALMHISPLLLTHPESMLFIVYFWCDSLLHTPALHILFHIHLYSFWLVLIHIDDS